MVYWTWSKYWKPAPHFQHELVVQVHITQFFPPSLYWAMHSKQTCIQNGILYRLTWSGRRLSLKQKKKRFTFAAHTVLSTEWFLASITQKTWIVCKKGPTANTYTTNDFAESVSDPLIPPGGKKYQFESEYGFISWWSHWHLLKLTYLLISRDCYIHHNGGVSR